MDKYLIDVVDTLTICSYYKLNTIRITVKFVSCVELSLSACQTKSWESFFLRESVWIRNTFHNG